MQTWSPWFLLTVAVLATWRVAHLIAHEDGPFALVVRLRMRVGDGALGALMDCPYCLSLWLAAPLALPFATRAHAAGDGVDAALAWLLAWLAISGGACLIERLSARDAAAASEPSTPARDAIAADDRHATPP